MNSERQAILHSQIARPEYGRLALPPNDRMQL